MKSILLIGLGRFGMHMATELSELGHEIMAVDRNEEKVNEALPFVTNALIGDSTNPEFLKTLGVDNYDVCIVAIAEDFQSSLETTSQLSEMGARFVVSRAEYPTQEKFLLRNGANEVVFPEKQVSRWAAIRYTADHILDYIEIDDDYSIFEVSVPKQWYGKAVRDLDIRPRHGINIIALKEKGKTDVRITPDSVLTPEKTMLVMGEYKEIQKCFHI